MKSALSEKGTMPVDDNDHISTTQYNTLKSIITLTLNDIEKDVEKTYRQYSHLKSPLVTSDIMKNFIIL